MYITSLMPLDTLPPSLVPSLKYPRPPRMYFGWRMSDTVIARLMEKAEEAQIVVRRSRYVPCSREENPNGLKIVDDDIDKIRTLERTARSILKELGVVTLPTSTIKPIALLTDVIELGFTLYSNRDLGDSRIPSPEDIARVGTHLGLTDKPQWWIGYEFHWIERGQYSDIIASRVATA